jgi:hypothetical protein
MNKMVRSCEHGTVAERKLQQRRNKFHLSVITNTWSFNGVCLASSIIKSPNEAAELWSKWQVSTNCISWYGESGFPNVKGEISLVSTSLDFQDPGNLLVEKLWKHEKYCLVEWKQKSSTSYMDWKQLNEVRTFDWFYIGIGRRNKPIS